MPAHQAGWFLHLKMPAKEHVVSELKCGCQGGRSEWSGVITVRQGQANDGS
jgi:hypothetical protein